MEFTSWDAGLHSSDPNSLEHYGVLGMKWGERRYQNPDGSLTAAGKRHYEQTGEYGYHYKSHATKKYTRKAAKEYAKADKYGVASNDANSRRKAWRHLNKAAKYKNRAERSAEIDKGEQEFAKKLSTGKAIAISLLGGSDIAKSYGQYRAMAKQNGMNSRGHKVASGILAVTQGSIGSRQRKAAYIRQDEGKKGLGQKVYKLNNKIQNKAGKMIDKGINKVVEAERRGREYEREEERRRRNR